MEVVRQAVLQVMRNRWAKSTTQQRDRLYEELLEEAVEAPADQPLQTTATPMIHKKNVLIQTKLTYAKNLHATLRQLNQDTHPLELHRRSSSDGGEAPTRQAEPITREVIENIVCPLPVKVALLIAWKTASRVDEIARLKPESIVESSPTEVIIYFGLHTKTSRSRPFLPQLFQVIKGARTDFIHENLQAAFQQWPTAAIIKNHIPKPYTMHSIKHGAGQVITKLAAEKRIDRSLIALVMKHSSATTDMPETTIRYLSQNKADLARALRSGEVTELL